MTLKELRLSRGLTQSEAAHRLGVKRTTVTMWECGKSKPSIETVKKLADIYKTTEQQILECF